jgi:hypothetical protein
MKKILLSAAVLVLVSAGFANNPPVTVNEKVLESFKKTFSTQQDVTWYENDNTFEARFTSGDIKTIAWYNKKGELVLTHRHYNGSKLPPMILSKLGDELPDQQIQGVTEITNKNSITLRWRGRKTGRN